MPIAESFPGSVRLSKLAHSSNALLPIEVSFAGIETPVIEVHPLKAWLPILVRLAEREMLLRGSKPRKLNPVGARAKFSSFGPLEKKFDFGFHLGSYFQCFWE